MVRNIGFSTLANAYRSVVQFILNIILAHFLLPEDFGLVALVIPITLLVLLVGDFGLAAAIIRNKTLSREGAGAAASVCAIFGFIVLLVTATCYAAGAFQSIDPQLAQLLVAFSVVMFFALNSVVPRALLERELSYNNITFVETLASTIGLVLAIAAAVLGWGVWSFLVYHLSMQVVRTAAYWVRVHHKVSMNMRASEAITLMGFGGWVVAFNLVNYFARNADNYIISHYLGREALGLYALAYQIMLLPMMALTWPASGVLLSTFSRLVDRPEIITRSFMSAVWLISSVTFPLMTYIAFAGPDALLSLLPHRWSGIAQILPYLAIAGALQSISSLSGALLLAFGRVKLQFWIGFFSTALVLLSFVASSAICGSIVSVAKVYLVISGAIFIFHAYIMSYLLSVHVFRMLKSLLGGLVVSVSGALGLFFAHILWFAPGAHFQNALVLSTGFLLAAVSAFAVLRRHVFSAIGDVRGAGRDATSIG